jgi:hypothetical protein
LCSESVTIDVDTNEIIENASEKTSKYSSAGFLRNLVASSKSK